VRHNRRSNSSGTPCNKNGTLAEARINGEWISWDRIRFRHTEWLSIRTGLIRTKYIARSP
jgi:hypothetical protein